MTNEGVSCRDATRIRAPAPGSALPCGAPPQVTVAPFRLGGHRTVLGLFRARTSLKEKALPGQTRQDAIRERNLQLEEFHRATLWLDRDSLGPCGTEVNRPSPIRDAGDDRPLREGVTAPCDEAPRGGAKSRGWRPAKSQRKDIVPFECLQS